MQERKNNINDVLGALDTISTKNVYPVYIPSLKRNVMFRELTTGQQKAIVKTIIDNPIYNSAFIFAIRDIIKKNCAEDIDLDSLTIIDKTAICLVMRQKSVGDTFEYIFKGTNKKKTISVSDYIDRIKEVNIPDQSIIETDSIRIVCKYPSILDEYSLEKEFHSNLSGDEINTKTDIKEAIGEVFINEVVKYIKQITIKNRDGEMLLDMTEFTFKNRINIIEKLGSTVLSGILEYIGNANKQINDILKVEVELTDAEQIASGNKTLTGVLGAGSDFFIIS